MCHYAKNSTTDFRNFDVKIFGDFFKIVNLELVDDSRNASPLGVDE